MATDQLRPGDYLLCHCSDPPVKVTSDHCTRTSHADPPKFTYQCPECETPYKACPTCMNNGQWYAEDGTRYTCHNCYPDAARNEERLR